MSHAALVQPHKAFSLITRMDSSYTRNVALVQPASRFCLETYIWCSLTKIPENRGVIEMK
jgi:hypothetical protein